MTDKTTPLADMKTADRFPAFVVKPGEEPRIRGYRLHTDLACHYGFIDATLLAITGELPSADRAAGLEKALLFLMDCPVNTAPTHATRSTMIGMAGPSGVTAMGLIALTAQAKEDAALFDQVVALADEGAPRPEGLAPRDDNERAAVSRLRAVLPWADLGVLAHDLGLVPAILGVFHRCGIERHEQCFQLLVLGRMTTTLAEGFGDFQKKFAFLPNGVPELVYEGGTP